MLMVCERCAAPLDVPENAAMVRCQHCGVQVRLRAPNQPVRVAQRGSTLFRRLRLVPTILGVGGALMAALGSFVFKAVLAPAPAIPALPRAPGAPPLSAPAAPSGPAHFSASPRMCQVDANGDGVTDSVGFAGALGKPDQLMVIDGKAGNVLWDGGQRPAQSQLACLDTSWFVLVEPNFQAEFFQVRNLGASVRVLLRDKLSEAGMGDGCARLRTDDGSTQGVQLPTGTAVECKAKLSSFQRDPDTIIGLTDNATELRHGTRRYILSKRRSGTEMLTLTVREGDKTVWSRELPYAAPTFSTGIVVADHTIVLWAAEPGSRDRGMLIGLDEASGEQRYTVPSALMVSNSLQYFGLNGRYVLVQAWSSLLAYEPASGALAWKIGP